MSEKYWNSEKFKKLQKKWTTKLKKSGFEDIEQEDGNLKRWTATYSKARYRPEVSEAKETYYRLAGQFLHDHKFDNELEHKVWALHAEGISIRDIVKHLEDNKVKTFSGKVHKVIKKFADLMKKKYAVIEDNGEPRDEYCG